MKPPRDYEALRRYRITIEGASYFVTVCTQTRRAGLNHSAPASAIARQLHFMATDRAVVPRAWVIMPDHLHLFIIATGELTLGQVIGRLKTKTRGALATHGLAWQGNYYEHRLRPDDAAEDLLRYLYLNPYRASLVSAAETYAHFWLSEAERRWFYPTLQENRPIPEWLV